MDMNYFKELSYCSFYCDFCLFCVGFGYFIL